LDEAHIHFVGFFSFIVVEFAMKTKEVTTRGIEMLDENFFV